VRFAPEFPRMGGDWAGIAAIADQRMRGCGHEEPLSARAHRARRSESLVARRLDIAGGCAAHLSHRRTVRRAGIVAERLCAAHGGFTRKQTVGLLGQGQPHASKAGIYQ